MVGLAGCLCRRFIVNSETLPDTMGIQRGQLPADCLSAPTNWPHDSRGLFRVAEVQVVGGVARAGPDGTKGYEASAHGLFAGPRQGSLDVSAASHPR